MLGCCTVLATLACADAQSAQTDQTTTEVARAEIAPPPAEGWLEDSLERPLAELDRPDLCVAATDEFAAPLDRALWLTTTEGVGTTRGALRLPLGGEDGESALARTRPFGLEAFSISVAIASSPAAQTAEVHLELTDSQYEWVSLYKRGDELAARYTDRGRTHDALQIAYDPALHRFWRIRGDRTRLLFEASADGTRWTTLGGIASPMNTRRGQATVRAFAAADTSPSFVSIDDFELRRACTSL
jgi:hypothetical protein